MTSIVLAILFLASGVSSLDVPPQPLSSCPPGGNCAAIDDATLASSLLQMGGGHSTAGRIEKKKVQQSMRDVDKKENPAQESTGAGEEKIDEEERPTQEEIDEFEGSLGAKIEGASEEKIDGEKPLSQEELENSMRASEEEIDGEEPSTQEETDALENSDSKADGDMAKEDDEHDGAEASNEDGERAAALEQEFASVEQESQEETTGVPSYISTFWTGRGGSARFVGDGYCRGGGISQDWYCNRGSCQKPEACAKKCAARSGCTGFDVLNNGSWCRLIKGGRVTWSNSSLRRRQAKKAGWIRNHDVACYEWRSY